MGPIRVALIGLSSRAKTSWAATAHLPYLTSARGKAHYEIVALLNSSVQAAEAAREAFELPPSVKTFGDSAELAADPDIDLVVCNTRVDSHFATTEPSFKAGKVVYVEWPPTESLELAYKLVDSPRFGESIIGLQTPFLPSLIKVKEVLASARIGRILSSDLRAHSNVGPPGTLPEALAYFAERKVGGNDITIGFTHMINWVHVLIGEFASFESRAQIQRSKVKVLGKDASHSRTVPSDVPDLVSVHGKLAKGRADIVDDATLTVTWRTSPPFKGEPALIWIIYSEKGELRFTSPSGPHLEIDLPEPPKVELYDYATDEVQEIEWDWEDWQKELPLRSRMVGVVYDRYARLVEQGTVTSKTSDEENYPRLSDGIRRLKEISTIFANFDAQS